MEGPPVLGYGCDITPALQGRVRLQSNKRSVAAAVWVQGTTMSFWESGSRCPGALTEGPPVLWIRV